MIVLKSDREINEMRQAGAFAFELLELAESMIQPGLSTGEINDALHEKTLSRGGVSAPLNYKGFPKALCTSVNSVVCHGIPSSKHILENGDIINVDVTPILNGFHGDSSRTFVVGEATEAAMNLVNCAKTCLEIGIEAIKAPQARVGDIGAGIQRYAEARGYGVTQSEGWKYTASEAYKDELEAHLWSVRESQYADLTKDGLEGLVKHVRKSFVRMGSRGRSLLG